MFKSLLALYTLVFLALLSSVVTFVLGSLEFIANTIGVSNTLHNLNQAEFKGMCDTILYFPCTVLCVLSQAIVGDSEYLVSTIETAYGSIRWRYTGTIKHSPQYTIVRIEPCPEFLTRLAALPLASDLRIRTM